MMLTFQIAFGIILGGAGLVGLYIVAAEAEDAYRRWLTRREERKWQEHMAAIRKAQDCR